ncbi:hypothetical protein, partial [Streptomyces sp. 8K308]|uniref:hypothetical protein n=1 Tax=Streptomyces sp. 8K308 TaxID=2530388 RepID=UPI001A9D87D7
WVGENPNGGESAARQPRISAASQAMPQRFSPPAHAGRETRAVSLHEGGSAMEIKVKRVEAVKATQNPAT